MKNFFVYFSAGVSVEAVGLPVLAVQLFYVGIHDVTVKKLNDEVPGVASLLLHVGVPVLAVLLLYSGVTLSYLLR